MNLLQILFPRVFLKQYKRPNLSFLIKLQLKAVSCILVMTFLNGEFLISARSFANKLEVTIYIEHVPHVKHGSLGLSFNKNIMLEGIFVTLYE